MFGVRGDFVLAGDRCLLLGGDTLLRRDPAFFELRRPEVELAVRVLWTDERRPSLLFGVVGVFGDVDLLLGDFDLILGVSDVFVLGDLERFRVCDETLFRLDTEAAPTLYPEASRSLVDERRNSRALAGDCVLFFGDFGDLERGLPAPAWDAVSLAGSLGRELCSDCAAFFDAIVLSSRAALDRV